MYSRGVPGQIASKTRPEGGRSPRRTWVYVEGCGPTENVALRAEPFGGEARAWSVCRSQVGPALRARDVPRTNRPQAASTPTGAAPKGTAYEPVRSKRKPAAAGPRAAPARQPRLSTPMMA